MPGGTARRCPPWLELFVVLKFYVKTEVHHKKTNHLYFVMYRPPGEPVKEFLNSIESSPNKVQTEKKKCFILGDFNIDLLNPSTPSKTSS